MQSQSGYTAVEYALFFQQGEEKGFTWFFRQLYPSLTFFANKIIGNTTTAEEIASEAFIKIWQRYGQFRDPESIRAYLYQIVRNDCLLYLRQFKKLQNSLSELTYLEKNDHQHDHFSHLVEAEMARRLRSCLQSLPPACEKVFTLLYLEGKTLRETAEALNLSPNTVKAQRRKGLQLLRKQLASFCFGWL